MYCMPQYLLLHYKNDAEIYELKTEESIFADAPFFKALGFETSDETYLLFLSKSVKRRMICDIVG